MKTILGCGMAADAFVLLPIAAKVHHGESN
jgi:hypothetical protein